MTFRRPLRACALLILAAVSCAAAPAASRQGQGARSATSGGRARYWCFDYALEAVTGARDPKKPIGHSAEDLRGILKERQYGRTDYVSLDYIDPMPRAGDVLIIGDAHAGVFLSDRLVNHYFGEVEAESAVRTWTIDDLASFTRRRNPENGDPIPPIRPFAAMPVQVWRHPVDLEPPVLDAAGEPRCRSVNPASRLRCRQPEGHAGAHEDWGGETWPAGAPAEARAGAPVEALPTEASIHANDLLELARRYRLEREYERALLALDEARQFVAGAARPGQPPADLSRRIANEMTALTAVLGELAQARLAELEQEGRAVADAAASVSDLRAFATSVATGSNDLLDQVRSVGARAREQIEEVASDIVNRAPKEEAEVQRRVDELHELAERACRATSEADARALVAAAEPTKTLVESLAAQSAVWQAYRRATTAPGAGAPFAQAGEQLARLEALLGTADPVEELLDPAGTGVRGGLARARAKAAKALADARAGLDRVVSLRNQVESAVTTYEMAATAGGGGAANRAAEWRRNADAARRLATEACDGLGDLARQIDQLDPGRSRIDLASARRELAAQTSRLAELERDMAGHDTYAAALLDMDRTVRDDVGRAESCVRTARARAVAAALAASNAAPAPQPRNPPPSASTGPAPAPSTSRPALPPQPGASPASAGPSRPATQPPAPSASVPVTTPPVDPNTAGGIRIQGGAMQIVVGQRVQFVATDYGNRPYKSNLTWTSMREDRLAIDAEGWATGLSPGRLSIVARYGDDMTDVTVVEVVPGPQGAQQQPPAVAAPLQAQPTAQPAAQPGVQPAQGRPTGQPAAQGGFTDYGGTTRRDPVAGQPPPPEAPGATETRPPGDASAFTFNAQPVALTTVAAGQPAAWHIFATGSRLGWAGGLGRYSVGPADQSIVQHLQVAGDHAMMANRLSFAPTLAWPGWADMRASFRSWADNLLRNPSNNVRRQISVDTAGNIGVYAQALMYQTGGETRYRSTCDAFYVRLGFQLAYGAQVLAIADEAVRNGDRYAAREPRSSALSVLGSVRSLLDQYEQVIPASGVCADLRDVRTLLLQLFALNQNDAAGQAATATRAWELANARIAALGGAAPGRVPAGQPPQPARSAPPADREPPQAEPPAGFGVAGDLSGEWILCVYTGQRLLWGSRIGPGDLAALRGGAQAAWWAQTVSTGVSTVSGDPESLRYRLVFTREGDQYVGRLGERSASFFIPRLLSGGPGSIPFAYAPGATVFRLARTGQDTYEGQFLDVPEGSPNAAATAWVPTSVRVEGTLFVQDGASGGTFRYRMPDTLPGVGHRLVWMRRPGG